MDENRPENLAAPVLTMQIIIFALTLGLVCFLAVVCVIVHGNLRNAFDPIPPLTLLSLGFAAMMVVIRVIVLRTLTAGARREILRGTSGAGGGRFSLTLPDRASGRLRPFYQTRMIVGAAMLEGATFFLLIAHLIERSPWTLAAAIVMILGVAAHFPTQERVDGWIERQTLLAQEEQQFEPVRRRDD